MINKDTKVLFLPVWYPSKLDNVLGIFVKHHALILNNSLNLAILHICPDPSLFGLTKLDRKLEDNLLVYRIYFFQFKIKLLRPLNWLLYLFASILGLFVVLKDFGRPNFIHVHVLTRAGIIAYLAKLLFKIPYCITEHWTRYLSERDSYKGIVRKFLTSFVIKNATGVSVVSVSLKEAMKKHNLNHPNFMVIPNAINFDTFSLKSKDFHSHSFTFIHVSGLTDTRKNVSGIIKALHILKNEGMDVVLNLVGDCSKKEDLKDLVRDLNLENSVCFSGELHGTDLVNAYHDAQAFVLFSFFENQPCVLLEAFSVGIPVIATNVGGVSEIVNAENGLLTIAGDYKLLARKMKSLILGIENYDAAGIRAHAKERFDYNQVRDRFLEFYRKSFDGTL